jgi:hypothetical protein
MSMADSARRPLSLRWIRNGTFSLYWDGVRPVACLKTAAEVLRVGKAAADGNLIDHGSPSSRSSRAQDAQLVDVFPRRACSAGLENAVNWDSERYMMLASSLSECLW